MAPAVRERVPRRAGDGAEMVVLDDEHVLGQDGAQLARPVGIERRAARVVPARGEHDGARARPLGGGERVREHAARVHRHRHEAQAEHAGDVEHARPARVLDRDRVAGLRGGR